MHDVIFVPEEDEEAYHFFYPSHIPLVGQELTLQWDEEMYRTYEVTQVEHSWKRVTKWDYEVASMRDNNDYNTIVHGKLKREDPVEK